MQSVPDPRLGHQVDRALLQPAGLDGLLDVLPGPQVDHDRLHPALVQQVRQHQPGRSRPDYSDLSAHDLAPSVMWPVLRGPGRDGRCGPAGVTSGDVDGHGGLLTVGAGQATGAGTDHPGDAGLQAVAGLVLRVAEEDVPVVDDTLDTEDLDLAETALAAAAVEHHVRATGLERLEHRDVVRHERLQPQAEDAHREGLRCEAAAAAEGLDPQVGGPATGLRPARLDRIEHRRGAEDAQLSAVRHAV